MARIILARPVNTTPEQTMTYEFECGASNCTFLIRTEDKNEIVEHVRIHAREKHDRDVDEDHVRDRIQSV